VPRKYSMKTRANAVDETRQRIIEATRKLHDEQGIRGTSMQDIADRAGVALATVYRHFPTIDELVPACGGRSMELNPPPTAAVFEAFEHGEERIAALVAALHATYARSARTFEIGFAEAVMMPVVARFMEQIDAQIGDLVKSAAAPFHSTADQLTVAESLCHFRLWHTLSKSGLGPEQVPEAVTRLVCQALTDPKAKNGAEHDTLTDTYPRT
jgi:AcrR family transcriptional regulator